MKSVELCSTFSLFYVIMFTTKVMPGQEYDIIDDNYNTIDVDICQPSNNTVCMEGEYSSVEPDGHLTTNIN
jgi:hypothetical protein